MIDAAVVCEIISVYAKHGWTLRRVLLSDTLEKHLANDTAELFSRANVQVSDLNAAWFSRDTNAGGTAWEIRHLSSTPFALVIVVDESSSDFEDIVRNAEERFRETVGKRITGH